MAGSLDPPTSDYSHSLLQTALPALTQSREYMGQKVSGGRLHLCGFQEVVSHAKVGLSSGASV